MKFRFILCKCCITFQICVLFKFSRLRTLVRICIFKHFFASPVLKEDMDVVLNGNAGYQEKRLCLSVFTQDE